MNPAFHAAAETARLGWVMGAMTIVFLMFFTGWTWWAYSRRNAEHLEQAARLPFDGVDE